jgi:colanic acid/amylovoran biosynthesis glycosyltransferase
MRLAYLVNQYPTISHTFIRREILGLEKLGVAVRRFALRQTPASQLRDPVDESERVRTESVLAHGGLTLIPAVARMSAQRPREFDRHRLGARFRAAPGVSRRGLLAGIPAGG